MLCRLVEKKIEYNIYIINKKRGAYMEGYKKIYERYCPNVKRNVIVEEKIGDSGVISSVCYNKSECEREEGGCNNPLFSVK